MAKQAHEAIGLGFVIGAIALFKGYTELPEGAEELLKENDPVKVVNHEDDRDIIVVKVDDNGDELVDGAGEPLVVERVYAEELILAAIVSDEEAASDQGMDAVDAVDAAAEEAPFDVDDAATTAGDAETTAEPAAKAAKPGAKSKAATKAAVDAKAKAATKSKATTPVPAPAAEELAELVDAASVIDILAEHDALEAAVELVNRAEQTDFTLGGVLRNIQETGVFKSLGFEGKRAFADYIEGSLGIAYRKAMQLIQNYTVIVTAGIDETKLAELGWSKVSIIARIVPEELKDNLDEIVAFATENTRDDLAAHIKTTYTVVRQRENAVKMTKFSFSLAEDEGEMVREGLAEACSITGDTDLNRAFAYIIGDWRGNAVGADMTLEDMVALIEGKFNVQVSVTEVAGGETAPAEAETELVS